MWKYFYICSPISVFQVSPWDKRDEANEKKQAFALASSDHLALLQAYKVLTRLKRTVSVFYM